MAIRDGVTVRGTSNANQRGNSEARRRRREWLVEAYRADVDVSVARTTENRVFDVQQYNSRLDGCGYVREAACRCYRCGKLLSADTVTVDRIVPGCTKTKMFPNGGTYVRWNIRPACGPCNSETGGGLRGTR